MKIIQYDANFYMQILNQVSDIVLTLNLDGQIIEVNQAAVDNYGYTRDELLEKNIVDLGNPNGIVAPKKQLEYTSNKEKGKEEHIRKDGSSFSVDIQSKSFIHGDDIYFVNIVLPSCDDDKRETIIEIDTQPMLACNRDIILKESELIQKYSLQNFEAGEWKMNLKSLEIQHSPNFASILGEEGKSDFSVESIMKKIVSGDRRLIRPVVCKAVKERTVFTIEFKLKTYGVESERWAQLIGKVSDENKGEPEFIRGLLFDITSRKLVEKKKHEFIIKKHEKFMNDIIGYLDFPLLIIDTEYRYKAYNKCHADAMRAMYGTDIELGQSLLSYISTDIDRATALRNFGKVFAGETIIQEDHAGDEKRQRNYYVGVFYPIRDENNRVVGATAFFRDITEYTKNTEALERSEKRYRQLVEDANLIIIEVDENENIIFINEYGLKIFSSSRHELIGKNFNKTLIPPNERMNNISAKQEENKESIRDTIEMIDRSGERLWLTLTYRWLRDKHGLYKGFIVIGTDVTKNVMARQAEKKRYKREFLEKMMSEAILKILSHEELILKIQQLGIHTSENYIVILLQKSRSKRIDTENSIFNKARYIDELLIDWLNDSNEKFAWFTPEGICVIWFCHSIKKEVVTGLVNSLLLRVAQFSPSLKVECGGSHTSSKFVEFVDVYEQALAAITYGEVFRGKRQWFYWQEFGSYQMILKSIHSNEALQFLEDQLGPLLEIENEQRRRLLLNTLREIVSCDSPEKISVRMHCHPGTVRYRKKVLGELLGYDFDSLNKIIDLKIALKIMDIQEMNL